MSWVAVAVVGGAVIGGVASSYAANQQADAAKDSAQTVADTNFQMNQANIQAQESAARYAAEAEKYAAGKISEAQMYAAQQAAEADKYAADQLYKAQQEALKLQRNMWQKQEADFQPFLEGGQQGYNQLAYGIGLDGYQDAASGNLGGAGDLSRDFTLEDFNVDPGYQFRLSEGMKALDRSASSKGNLLSGSTLKGVQRFGQDLASQEYQAAYSRFRGDQAWKYNQLVGLSDTGMNAAANIGAAGQNYANNAANILTGTAGAVAASRQNAATLQGQYAVNAGNQLAGNAISGAQYQGNLGLQYAGINNQLASNTANAYANSQMAQANANASAYTGWGNAISSGINALGMYYGYNSGGGSTAQMNAAGW